MKIKAPTTISALGLAVATASFSIPSHADAFYEALSGGKAKLDIRSRIETVDQDGIDDKAEAFTVRTRLGYETGALFKTTAYVEFEDVSVVGGFDEYGGTYPVVADPEVTEVNQAYLSIKPTEGMDIRFGTQRIILDNARFVGNVGWRQNEQTFDALNFQYKVAGFDITAAYIDQVHGIVANFDALTEDAILNVSYQTPVGKVTAYYYGLDHSHDNNAIQFDVETVGARLAGSAAVSDSIKLIYTAEYATQDVSEWAGNDTVDFSANYMLGEFGVNIAENYTVAVGMETLGSDEGAYGFQTPLATKHAFNGWADKFLLTPADGLEDTYLKGVVKAAGMKFVLVYHDYAGDESGDDLGSEINFVAVKPFAKKYKVGLKYASYSASDDYLIATDTDKVWLWGEMKF